MPRPPAGWDRLKWLGPGFLWMVSAAGSGELLFTPRVGSLYGYTLIWALLGAVILKLFINREIGRFSVCTGETLLAGFRKLPGPRSWALWVILIPQALVAIATIAGLAGSAATALILVLPGDLRLWMVASVLGATALVVWGRYQGVERAATAFAITLALAAVIAALSAIGEVQPIVAGVVPRIPPGLNHGEILPWLGFMLSGAAGMVWYSYWLRAKQYGAAGSADEGAGPPDPRSLNAEGLGRLQSWVRQMTLDISIAVAGTLIITLAFLVLGVELLRPQGLVPQEDRVALVLGQLLGGIWGPIGFWFMILAVFVGFWSTVLSDQDGFGRMFADGTRLLLRNLGQQQRWLAGDYLERAYVVVLVSALPIALYLLVGQPVGLLKIAGAIEAAHIPFVAGLTLYLNHQRLPATLRASMPVFLLTVLAGLFFALFAAIYLLQTAGGS